MNTQQKMLEIIKQIALAKKEEKNAINQIDAYETEQHIKRLTNEMVALYEEYVKDNSQTKTIYLAVDKDYTLHLFPCKPVRIDEDWDDPDKQCEIMTLTVPELRFFGIPYNRTWDDEPLKITITSHKE